MRDIYGEAAQLPVWLGPADYSSDVAMNVLGAMYRYHLRVHRYMNAGTVRINLPPPQTDDEAAENTLVASFGQSFGLRVPSPFPLPRFSHQAFADLFSRRYWGRGWCWQEFVVPKKVTIMCGDMVLEDGDLCMLNFMTTWDMLKAQVGRQPYRLDQRPWAMSDLRRWFRNNKCLQDNGYQDDPEIITPKEPMSAPILLQSIVDLTPFGKAWTFRSGRDLLRMKNLLIESSKSSLQTREKLDQIYALVGMSTDAKELGIVADYSEAWEDLYVRIATAYFQRGDLWCLHHCQTGVTNIFLGFSPHKWTVPSSRLPSWAPNWSNDFYGVRVSEHYRSPPEHLGTLDRDGLRQNPQYLGSGRLRIKAIFLSEVAWLSVERPTRDRGERGKERTRALLSIWLRSIVRALEPRHNRRKIWTTLIMNANRLPVPSSDVNSAETPEPSEETPEQLEANEEVKRLKLDEAFDHLLHYSRQQGVIEVDETIDHELDEALDLLSLHVVSKPALRRGSLPALWRDPDLSLRILMRYWRASNGACLKQ